MKSIIQASLLGALLILSAAALRAEDPLKAAPNMYSLVFENERVRVLQVSFKVGEKIAEHSHPDHFMYILEGGTLRVHAEGSVNDVTLTPGQVVWMPAVTHWAENVGNTPVKILVTELKEEKPKAKSTK